MYRKQRKRNLVAKIAPERSGNVERVLEILFWKEGGVGDSRVRRRP